MALKQLVYVSAARPDLPAGEHFKILQTARARNASNGVTGILLAIDNGFLQVLEGSQDSVDETFSRILADPRHFSIRKLHDAPCDRRSFDAWNMGFQELRGIDVLTEGSFPVTKAAMMDTLPAGLGPEILIFIRTFCAVNSATGYPSVSRATRAPRISSGS
jgi:Sensors of blue-light using FAD